MGRRYIIPLLLTIMELVGQPTAPFCLEPPKRYQQGAIQEVQNLISLLKADFVTVRDLEKKCFTLFAYAGGAFVVGIILFLSALLVFIGIPLMVIGLVMFFVSMVWITVLSKRPVWDIYCPYCSATNHVFKPCQRFDCDICGRPIKISDNGEAIALDIHVQHKAY